MGAMGNASVKEGMESSCGGGGGGGGGGEDDPTMESDGYPDFPAARRVNPSAVGLTPPESPKRSRSPLMFAPQVPPRRPTPEPPPHAIDEVDAWTRKHPSALNMFDEIVRASKGKHIVMFLDYDGTLSPIVDEPSRIRHTSSKRCAPL